MSFPTLSDFAKPPEEAQWDPPWSEWVELPPSEVGEGTIVGDTSGQYVSMSANIIQVSSLGSVHLLSFINARMY